MKKQRFFQFVGCLVFVVLFGCRHKPVSTTIAVLQNLQTATVYADKGGTLRWSDTDINLSAFQIVFYDNPCAATDVLHTIGESSEVVCNVIKSGPYIYQVLPYTGAPAPSPDPTKGAFSFAQVGGCTGCGRTAAKLKGQTANVKVMEVKPSTSAPNHLEYIACDSSHKNVSFEYDPSPTPYTQNQTISWQLNGSPTQLPSYGATFSQPSPCQEGAGPLQFCTIMQNISTKTFTYTVDRTDCDSASSNYSFTVQ